MKQKLAMPANDANSKAITSFTTYRNFLYYSEKTDKVKFCKLQRALFTFSEIEHALVIVNQP